MSVLEHYSDNECSILLGCVRKDVIDARARALQHLGRLMKSQKSEPATGPEDLAVRKNHRGHGMDNCSIFPDANLESGEYLDSKGDPFRYVWCSNDSQLTVKMGGLPKPGQPKRNHLKWLFMRQIFAIAVVAVSVAAIASGQEQGAIRDPSRIVEQVIRTLDNERIQAH